MADPDVRAAFEAAADALVALLETTGPEDLDRPATDAWRVRELAAHAARGLLAIETVLDAPVDEASPHLVSAGAYFRAAFAVDGVHAGIEERARAAAAEMGDVPAAYARACAARVLPRAAATPEDLEVQHFVGRLAFGEYLRTRVVELVLHTVDLSLALGRTPSAPDDAARVTAEVVLELVDRADALSLACALAGRGWPGARVDVLR